MTYTTLDLANAQSEAYDQGMREGLIFALAALSRYSKSQAEQRILNVLDRLEDTTWLQSALDLDGKDRGRARG